MKSSGFTLVEMLVVVAIIALLTSAATVSFKGVRNHGWRTRDRSTAQQIATAWSVYLQEERSFDFRGKTSHPPGGTGPFETTQKNLWPIAPFEEETDANGNKVWLEKDTVYFEISGEELTRGKEIARAMHDSEGGLFDHWKNRFKFSLDHDYDSEVTAPDLAVKKASAIAWSTCGTSNSKRWAVCWQ